ncbi:sporulation YhaL family protein [Jeotgalibacillus salarius]|nr:sporulation YhaL family protein [Jeotgalibacillus salarius]
MFPIWIDLAIGGAVLSLVMFVRTAYVDRKQEKDFIEAHGKTYIQRMKKEKKKRFSTELKD